MVGQPRAADIDGRDIYIYIYSAAGYIAVLLWCVVLVAVNTGVGFWVHLIGGI